MERSLRQIDLSVHLTSAATLEARGEVMAQARIKDQSVKANYEYEN